MILSNESNMYLPLFVAYRLITPTLRFINISTKTTRIFRQSKLSTAHSSQLSSRWLFGWTNCGTGRIYYTHAHTHTHTLTYPSTRCDRCDVDEIHHILLFSTQEVCFSVQFKNRTEAFSHLFCDCDL